MSSLFSCSYAFIPIIKLLVIAFLVLPEMAAAENAQNDLFLQKSPAGVQIDEEAVDLFCLKSSYPQIVSIRKENDNKIIVFGNGQELSYAESKHDDFSPKESMRQIYPLEPVRPETPQGFAPGRERSYALLQALYGSAPLEIQKNLKSVKLFNRPFLLNLRAAQALEQANLEAIGNKDIKKFLKSDGGYYWRKISGENKLSAHSFGIALDFSAHLAPYWRWSKKSPHPMQKTYPSEIVSAMEDAGFIWGGKWHEYDIMHFEYRPEMICKAKILNRLKSKSGIREKKF